MKTEDEDEHGKLIWKMMMEKMTEYEDGKWRLNIKDGGQKMENGKLKMEDGRQKMEVL